MTNSNISNDDLIDENNNINNTKTKEENNNFEYQWWILKNKVWKWKNINIKELIEYIDKDDDEKKKIEEENWTNEYKNKEIETIKILDEEMEKFSSHTKDQSLQNTNNSEEQTEKNPNTLNNVQYKVWIENIKQMRKKKIDKEVWTRRKKLFVRDFIQLIIWTILLIFSYNYLIENPAELTAMVSWVKILYQKVQIFLNWFFNDNWKILTDKYEREGKINNIISDLKKSWCETQEDLDEITSYYNYVVNMDLETYVKERTTIINKINEEYIKFNENCKNLQQIKQ